MVRAALLLAKVVDDGVLDLPWVHVERMGLVDSLLGRDHVAAIQKMQCLEVVAVADQWCSETLRYRTWKV